MNWQKKNIFRWSWLLLLCLFPVMISCSGESDKVAKKKLQVILDDDLSAILEGIPDSALLKKPYYDIVSYKLYDEGNYSKKAVADFYFLNSVPVKILRKYRYHRTKRMWDRYFNEYSFFSDSANSLPKK